MGQVLLVYGVIQCISTAYGLTVIGAVKPLIEQKLHEKGYIEKNKSSLYQFNEKLGNFFKGFIPFYYAYKAIKLVEGRDCVDRAVDEEIISGDNYITHDEQMAIFNAAEEANRQKVNIYVPEPKVEFEKPEKYKATKIDNSIYDRNETPVEYIEKEMEKEDSLQITPFTETDRIRSNVLQYNPREVTSEDVARYIGAMDYDTLLELGYNINQLAYSRKNKQRVLEKEVA